MKIASLPGAGPCLRLVSLLICPAALHAASDVTVSAALTSGGAFSGANPRVFTPVAAAAFVQSGAIQTELNAGNGVTLETASAAAGNGDLQVISNLTKSTAGASPLVLKAVRDLNLSVSLAASTGTLPLTLSAGRNILTSQAITTNGGAIVLSPAGDFSLGGSLNAGAGTISLQSGMLRSANSQTVTASTLTVASGAALRLQGTLAGSLTVAGSLSAAAPGVTGSLQVNGGLTLQAGSITAVELSGTGTSSYDRIIATGAATVAGTLQVDLTGGFADAIAPSSVFTIIQGSSVTGTFDGLPQGSRYVLSNDRGSLRVNYTATAVTLDDWQPRVTTLAWDPGTAEAGTAVFSNTNTRAGRHYFKIVAQSTDIGAWRSRLTMISGEASLYFQKGALATSSSSIRSNQTGSDGLVLREDQYAAGEEWSLMVDAEEGAKWKLVSGRAYVHDLGALPFTDANSNGQYEIGEAVAPQDEPAAPMPPEGIRFYKAVVPTGTPAWSLWLNGSTRDLAIRTNKVPFHDSTNRYTRKQAGQMLVVPPVLAAGTWFASVVAPQGEVIGLDSRIQTVSDLAFNGSVSNVAVNGAPYRVFRTQVPVDQIAWDLTATPLSGNPNLCVRKGNVPAEFDNEAFSEAPGDAVEGITMVPNYLTDGTWYITVWGNAAYSFHLKNGDPVITPLSFTDTKVNDQPGRSGWRFYALTDVPAQVGALGWELQLANQAPGTQIALRRNKVPSRWQKREGGATSATDTGATYMDDSSVTGFLQRVNHQADVWYVGVYSAQQSLGAFTLDVHPFAPPTLAFEGSATAVNGIPALKWQFYRMDVPAGIQGWDLRLRNPTGGSCTLVVRRDLLPNGTGTNNGSSPSPWSASADPVWASGYQWAAEIDWTGRKYDTLSTPHRDIDDRLVMAMGRPLQPGTYYIGIYNSGADPMTGQANQPASMTLESRAIGSGLSIPVTDLAFTAGSSVAVENLAPREAAYYKITVPENTPSWEFSLTPSAGEMLMAVRRDTVPDCRATAGRSMQALSNAVDREVLIQKTGPERYLLLPDNNQTAITAGDYYLAVISEGVNPPASNVIGTGVSSGTLTNLGPIAVQDLGAASAAGLVQPVSLTGAQVKAYQFTVPAGTASLEVRLDNRVGNPQMTLISGLRVPQPDSSAYDYGTGGGQTAVPTGSVGRITEDDLLTLANPPAGVYTLTVRADDLASAYPAASANLAIVANSPVPLAFSGTASITGQAATSWRYFQVTVPAGVMGWDLRLKDITGGHPQMVVRRDQLPSIFGTNNGVSGSPWSASSDTNWPTGYQWGGGVDWTGRTYSSPANPRRAIGDRMIAAMGRPLEPGTYIVGVYNSGTDPINGGANVASSYTVESRGMGAGQAIGIGELAFAGGSSVTVSNLTPREAAYFKVTVPAGVPRWDFALTPTAGEMMVIARRGVLPDFNASDFGNPQDNGSRQVKLQKTGAERYGLLPENNQDFIVAGDYYFAVVSEGVNPPSSAVIGAGVSSAVLTSLGSPGIQDLGTAGLTPIGGAVDLASVEMKAYRFTIPAGLASLEIRLEGRVGNPQMVVLSGPRVPYPGVSTTSYGSGGGQSTVANGAMGRVADDNLIALPNPIPGLYTLTVRAEDVSSAWPPASANLVIVASEPEELPLDTGLATVTGQAATAWKFFKVTVPAGVLGWDLRLKNITGGNPTLIVRRDQMPAIFGTNNGVSGSPWSASSDSTWPSSYQFAAARDWTARAYDVPSGGRRDIDDRLVVAAGRPLVPGVYYVGIYNDGADPVTGATNQPVSYTVESRWIGTGIPVGTLGFAAGSSVTVSNLTPREAAYFKVTVPENTPSWEFTLSPTAGEALVVARRGFIPDFNASTTGDPQDENAREVKLQKAGPERYLLLPLNNQNTILAGDYYLAVVSEGVNPPASNVIGAGTVDATLTSLGSLAVSSLGTVGTTPITRAVSLAGAQVKGYQFTIPEGVVSLELQLNNRAGNPCMAIISGSRLPVPDTSNNDIGCGGGQSSTPTGGVARVLADSLITLPNPPAGIYSLTVKSDDPYGDATADLVIVARPRGVLNFAASLNGNGLSHSDTRQLANGQKQFYEVAVPATLEGQPVLGWLLKLNHAQGDTTLQIYKQWGNPGSGISVPGNSALIVPPFLTFGETWYIEVTASGLTNYTLTSQPVTLARPAWTMPTGHNFTFGDSGNDSAGNPLPGDRGVDIGQDDWHFYAIDVPQGNSGLLRTELKAINGNPNLYLREDGVPTTDHKADGLFGASLVHRRMEDTGSEYGNWVPFDGKSERQLRPGRWILGVKATGGSNARYRLIVSTGQVTDLNLAGASVANQTLIGRDWRYYRFTVPADAPATWNLGFTQQVGDVVMWLRDSVPAGQGGSPDGAVGTVKSWASDGKNQGPYEAGGHDAAATYAFATPPLRPGHTYYAGFRANSDATFSLTSGVTGSAPAAAPVAFYGGVIDTLLPAGGTALYRIDAPAEGTRLKWTSTHPATVQLRLEQGTLPSTTGNQHFTGSGANSSFNKTLSATPWPWLPSQSYYLLLVNNAGSPAAVKVNLSGQNAATEDEDNDGLPDAWETTHFGSTTQYHGASDPDADGVTNAVELVDGTLPNDVNSAKYFLNVNANFGSVTRSPDQPKYDRGTVVTLSATPNAGLVFNGWSGSAGGRDNPLTLTMLSNKDITAQFGIPLPVALDASALTWTTGGDAIWTGQTVTTRDGVDAAQSGAITHGQQTWLQTTVSGPGTFAFFWKVSSASSSDFLEFWIDGVLQTGRISGNQDWAQKTSTLGGGDHTLRWRYVKDASNSAGADAGWVDQVTWMPVGGYSAWLATYFTSAELANPALVGPEADPDGDGAANVLEYAFGRHPRSGDATDRSLGSVIPEVAVIGGSRRLGLRFSLPDSLPVDVHYEVEVSDDLTVWTKIADQAAAGGWTGSATSAVAAPVNGRREVRITDTGTPAGGTQRMGRIRVTLQ